tara:strand:+ start:3453 stop:3731 length:279 start_codon:yes stop_codon:yes gene_type:complete
MLITPRRALVIIGLYVTAATAGSLYANHRGTQAQIYRDNLQTRVEQIIDIDKNGASSYEWARVYDELGINPPRELRTSELETFLSRYENTSP